MGTHSTRWFVSASACANIGAVLQCFLRTENRKESKWRESAKNDGRVVDCPAHADRYRTPRGVGESRKKKGQPRTVALEYWWRRGGSNSRPSHCERDALPAELRPRMAYSIHKNQHRKIDIATSATDNLSSQAPTISIVKDSYHCNPSSQEPVL